MTFLLGFRNMCEALEKEPVSEFFLCGLRNVIKSSLKICFKLTFESCSSICLVFLICDNCFLFFYLSAFLRLSHIQNINLSDSVIAVIILQSVIIQYCLTFTLIEEKHIV